MNQNPSDNQETPRRWNEDIATTVAAIRNAEDSTAIIETVEHIIAGKRFLSGDLLAAIAERDYRVPTELVYRLAKRFPEYDILASMFCCRRDATPAMLDDWAENPRLAPDLAYNPKTAQETIDRLLIRARSAGDIPRDLFIQLAMRASMGVLERLLSVDAPMPIKYALSERTNDELLLWRLATDPAVRVRESVALNPHAPQTLVSALAGDSDPIVRESAVANPHISKAALAERAMMDDDANVVAEACRRLADPEVIRKTVMKWWQKPRNEDVIPIEEAALGNECTPDDIRVTIQI